MDHQVQSTTAPCDDMEQSVKKLHEEAKNRSITALLARHSRERLFCHPLLWDHRQPALLQCNFLPYNPPAIPSLPATEGGSRILPSRPSVDDEIYYVRRLQDTYHSLEIELVGKLLQPRCPEFLFDYEDDPFDAKLHVKRKPLCQIGSCLTLGPSMAAFSRRDMQYYRENKIERSSYRAQNNYFIFKSLTKRLKPPPTLPDPCVAAVCIALGQHQRSEREKEDREGWNGIRKKQDCELQSTKAKLTDYERDTQKGVEAVRGAKAFPVIVLVYEDEYTSVFTADVTCTFLAKLDEPGKSLYSDASLDIHEQRVEYRPFDSYADRLADVIGDTLHKNCNDDIREDEANASPSKSVLRVPVTDDTAAKTAKTGKRKRNYDRNTKRMSVRLAVKREKRN